MGRACHQQRVAIGCRFCNKLCAYNAAAAVLIFNLHANAQLLGQFFGHRTGNNVGRAAWAKRHNDSNRFIGIGLRLYAGTTYKKTTQQQRDYSFYALFHLVSSYRLICYALFVAIQYNDFLELTTSPASYANSFYSLAVN